MSELVNSLFPFFVSHLPASVSTSLCGCRLGSPLIALVQPSAEISSKSSYLASLVAFLLFLHLPAFQCFLISFHLSHFPFALSRTSAPVTYEDAYRFMHIFFPSTSPTFFLKPGG